MALLDRARRLILLRGVLSQRLDPRLAPPTSLGGAVAIVGLAILLRLLLAPWITGAQFITFFPAAIVSTLLFGTLAGVAAVALSAVAAALTVLMPDPFTSQEQVALMMFVVVAGMDVAIISVLLEVNETLRRTLSEKDLLNGRLQASEARFRELVETAPDAIVIVDRKERIVIANAEAERLFGYAPGAMRGRAVDVLMPKRFRANHYGRIADFPGKGGVRRMGDGEELMGVRSDGVEFPIETNLSALPGSAEGLVCGVIRDLTVRREHEERRSLLIRELNHRVKNTLASVQSIVSQTLRAAADPKAFSEALTARIIALSQSHDVLTRNDWTGARIGEIVAEQLRPYERASGAPFRLLGPAVTLPPNRAVTLGMVIGELATNAAKFGALSTTGSVEVTWEQRTDHANAPVLTLTWIERGGPRVEPPTRTGFGARLIARSLAAGLHGSARIRYDPEGVTCELSFPLSPHEADGQPGF